MNLTKQLPLEAEQAGLKYIARRYHPQNYHEFWKCRIENTDGRTIKSWGVK